MTTTRVTLAAGCALGALLTTPALAQAADPVTVPAATTVDQPDNASSDIIVTARRQNERLLDVPASVTVLTAKTLEVTGIKTDPGQSARRRGQGKLWIARHVLRLGLSCRAGVGQRRIRDFG